MNACHLLTRRDAVLVVAMFGAILSGCSTTMSGLGGSSEFNCKAPVGIPCRSVSAVDHAVQTGQVGRAGPSAQTPTSSVAPGELPSRPAIYQNEGGVAGAVQVRTIVPAGSDGAEGDASLGAIRSEATVIRIWIAPYEDNDGDLHEASRVYLQIDSGRWLIEHNRERIKRDFSPGPARGGQAAAAPRSGRAGPETPTATRPVAAFTPQEKN